MKMRFEEGMALTFEPASRAEEKIQQIYIVLSTTRGEVPCYRDFGVDREYLHKPVLVAKTMYAAAIFEAITRYVDGVTVTGVTFENDADTPDMLRPILEVTFDE